jgi:SnoaL-like domain
MRGARLAPIALAAALVAAAVFGWRAWTGGEERVIRARLASLVAEINARPGEGLGAVAHAAEIGSYFTEDVQIDLGPGTNPIQGRPMLIGMASRLGSRLSAFELVLEDVVVELTGDTAADVRLTASFVRRDTAAGLEPMDPSEFAVDMTRADGTWRIARLTVVQILR